MTGEGDELVDWGDLVPLIVHPTKLAIIEALRWVDEPLSAVDIKVMYEGELSTSAISYHLRSLAYELPVLRLYRKEKVRGAKKKCFYFRDRKPASRRKKKGSK